MNDSFSSGPDATVPCPNCGHSLTSYGEVEINGGVSAKADPDGKARLDFAVKCVDCESEFCIFVAVEDLVKAP